MTLPAIREEAPPPVAIADVVGRVTCRVRLSLFTEEFASLDLVPGGTIAELLEAIAEDYPIAPNCSDLVWLQGREIAPEHRGLIRPKAGTFLCVARVPGDARTALLIGGTIALAALSGGAGLAVAGAITSPALGAIAGGVVTAGIPICGSIGWSQL